MAKSKLTISVSEVAEKLGVSSGLILAGLEQGKFPFGACFRIGNSERRTSVISRHGFYEYFGIEEEENED